MRMFGNVKYVAGYTKPGYIIAHFAVLTSTPGEVIDIIAASTRNIETTATLSALMLVPFYGACRPSAIGPG